MSWWDPQPFQLSSYKNFKKRVLKLESKRQVEFVKEGVIGYIVPRKSAEGHVIESAWQNTDIARKADSRMVMNSQSCVMEFCILFWDHISSFTETCLVFVSLLFWNPRMFSISFWQNILIKLQHAIKVNQSWRLKVFWLQKWLDACWNDMRWPNKFWAHT